MRQICAIALLATLLALAIGLSAPATLMATTIRSVERASGVTSTPSATSPTASTGIPAISPTPSPSVNAESHLHLFGVNLIVNGGAETLLATGSQTIPANTSGLAGWTVQGGLTSTQYMTNGLLTAQSPGPPMRGQRFFVGGPLSARSRASQSVDLSPASTPIHDHLVRYALSGWLGGSGKKDDGPVVQVSFINAQGRTLDTAEIGPVPASLRANRSELVLRRESGRVPPETQHAVVVLQCQGTGHAACFADNLALVLIRLKTVPPLFHNNLIANSDAENADASPNGNILAHIPDWTVTGKFNVYAYNRSVQRSNLVMSLTSPGPARRGNNYFSGGPDNAASSASQVIDVTRAETAIDTGVVTYTLSGYLGGYGSKRDTMTLHATFRDGRGSALSTITLGPVTPADRKGITGLLFRSATGSVPVGTRSIVVAMQSKRATGIYDDGYADNLSLILSAGQPTTRTPKTVVPTPVTPVTAPPIVTAASTIPLTATLIPVATQQVGTTGGALRAQIAQHLARVSAPVTQSFALVIPSAALTQTASVGIAVVPPASVPTTTQQTNNAPIGAAISLNAADRHGRAIGRFRHHLVLQFSYRRAALFGLDERTLTIAFYDKAHALWVPLPTTIDQNAELLTARVTHFTLFQVRATAHTSAQLQGALHAAAASTLATRPAVQSLPAAPSTAYLYHFVGSLLPGAGQSLVHVEGALRLAIEPLTGDLSDDSTLTQTNGQDIPISGTLTTQGLALSVTTSSGTYSAFDNLASTAFTTTHRLSGIFVAGDNNSTGAPVGFWVATTAAGNIQQTYAWHEQVTQGPDHGTIYTGTLMLLSDTYGGVIGQITLTNETIWPVGGQSVNGVLNLQLLVRTGTLQFAVGTAGGTTGGSLSGIVFGPLAGDLGTWAATIQTSAS